MTPYERHQVIIHGQEPDRIAVNFAPGLRKGPTNGMVRRLQKRGMGIMHIVSPYKPTFFYDMIVNPMLPEIVYRATTFKEQGVWKIKHELRTPIGTVDSIVGLNPGIELATNSPMTHFIKKKEDWKVINYLFKSMCENMVPNYEEMASDQADLGETGITIAFVDKTPFQRAWIELATLEDAVFGFFDMTEEVEEYLEIQTQFHKKAAEITAECPSQHIHIIDNITNTISPDMYRQYCMPFYKMYSNAIQGTDKVLAVHHDGLISHLCAEIAEASFNLIDSFTVPPVGDVSLKEAKSKWPDKILCINLPPHLITNDIKLIRREYEKIIDTWGSKKLIIEHVEDLPDEILPLHLDAALDVCGYPS